jgi:hypothetical protein
MVTSVCTGITVVSGALCVRKQNMLRGWIEQRMDIVTVKHSFMLRMLHMLLRQLKTNLNHDDELHCSAMLCTGC